MSIKVGEKVPYDITLWKAVQPLPEDGACPIPTKVQSNTLFEGKKVVLVAVPGAFTPTCSVKHIPGFVEKIDEIKAKGIDAVYCIAVNDGFVMSYWAADQKAGDKVQFFGDGNGDFTKKIGLTKDCTAFGLGIRSERYAIVIHDGIVKSIAVDAGAFGETSVEAVLAKL
ncbi:peroxiredoxin [Cavenderia fasciculata]|uniref:Peroxiredoxin n=1 Tax=Cavenderia fasciculata TaxID=261658 RepID=F4PV25_CACFS|nr:peroxiredoxin [Cavenderia fasciculata]EGG21141.1 peroxiredoxin [Cavenderia fasciculata]|eukprot:XP_004358991.1 peroxiredoxin [Cavenderia fasciculata]